MVMEEIEIGGQQGVDVGAGVEMQLDLGGAVAIAVGDVLLHGPVVVVGLDLRGLGGGEGLAGAGRATVVDGRDGPGQKGIGRQAVGGARSGQGHLAGERLQGRGQGVAGGGVPLHHGRERAGVRLGGAGAGKGEL